MSKTGVSFISAILLLASPLAGQKSVSILFNGFSAPRTGFLAAAVEPSARVFPGAEVRFGGARAEIGLGWTPLRGESPVQHSSTGCTGCPWLGNSSPVETGGYDLKTAATANSFSAALRVNVTRHGRIRPFVAAGAEFSIIKKHSTWGNYWWNPDVPDYYRKLDQPGEVTRSVIDIGPQGTGGLNIYPYKFILISVGAGYRFGGPAVTLGAGFTSVH